MKLKHRLFALPEGFYPCVMLFVLALCLVCVGVVIVSFRSAIMERQDHDATRFRRPNKSPTIHGLVEPRQGATQRAQTAELASSARREVYLDPVTGQFGAPPPGTKRPAPVLSPEEENALSSSSEGLVQTPLMGPRGGVKIDLQGRFRSEVVATISAQSNLSIRCGPGTVGSENLRERNDGPTPTGLSENKGAYREK